MDTESRNGNNPIRMESWRTILILAYQSLGVVYGELSTSPLYVYGSTFAEDIQHSATNEEIFGVFSFVFWTLTLIPLVKYVIIVLIADDNGEGGTFALYSLLCRHARLSTLPNAQLADESLLEYNRDEVVLPNRRDFFCGVNLKSTLAKNKVLQKVLLVLALIGACMVIGDGVLTPAISVFSAVSGLEFYVSKEHHQYVEVPVACVILVILFCLQRYGTHRIGFLFAPIIITWLICISSIGLYNILYWNPHVYKAISPYYMYKFLKKTQRRGWMSLGGILLCMTGSEAMYADLGHFSKRSIQIAFTFLVYPALILAYMGQAAYLSKHHIYENNYQTGFYASVPEKMRWPVLGMAILAAVVGSQSIITATFSIIKQCSALNCFPRVKIIHTSSKMHGQIYIPEINWTLMLLCLAVTLGFRDTKHMSNAAGLAVITVMLVTTWLMSLVIIICWRQNVFLAICFMFFFGSVEALYFSASLIKFLDGAWVPIALAFIFLIIMYIWHYGTRKKYEFELQNKVPISWINSPSLEIQRVPGIGLVLTDIVTGLPSVFSHFITNLPAFHRFLIFLCVKSVPVPHVRPEERFLVVRIGPKQRRLYRCIARYGYCDMNVDYVQFEKDLISCISEFIRTEREEEEEGSGVTTDNSDDYREMTVVGSASSTSLESQQMDASVQEELEELNEAREQGLTFIRGRCYVKAKNGSGLLKRFVINFGYDFLRRISRGAANAVSFPHASTLEVGMIYDV